MVEAALHAFSQDFTQFEDLQLSGNLPEAESRLRELHPYDVPEFIVIPVADGSADYLAWLTENTRK